MFWSLAIVRGTYGIIGALFSAYERYFDTELQSHPTKGKTELSYLVVLSHFGFFVFEWFAQIYFDYRFKTVNYQLHAHHTIAFIGYSGAAVFDVMHHAGCTTFMLEMSTPFSCICYCLIKCGMANTFLWKANQFVLIHVFHMRTLVEFTMIYETVKYWSDFKQLPLILLANWSIGLVIVTFYLTPYWTWKKTEQMFTKSELSTNEKVKNN